MLNEGFRITPRDDRSCDLSWAAPSAESVSWVFIDGKHVLGPFCPGAVERMVKVPLAAGDMAAVEVHDFPDGSVRPEPVHVAPNTRPTLAWNAVPDTVRYRIYHRKFGEAAEEIVYDRPALQGIERCEISCPVELAGKGGIWHFFRVEAVDECSNESARQAWVYFVTDLPGVPAHLSVADGATPGTYTFALEA